MRCLCILLVFCNLECTLWCCDFLLCLLLLYFLYELLARHF
ncbi:putative E5 [Bos taurus papillomavirus 8]|uniref:Putative E5 n=1 Tax=Bos taurus papillomavirus 8 TaxID=2758968 RepID=A6XA96_9PAPI|nr:putative E5 [Bos taurus papillomavirus 8]